MDHLQNEIGEVLIESGLGSGGGGSRRCAERAAGAHERERGPPQELRLHARQLRRPPGGSRPGDGRLARGQVRARRLQPGAVSGRLVAEVSVTTAFFQTVGVHRARQLCAELFSAMDFPLDQDRCVGPRLPFILVSMTFA